MRVKVLFIFIILISGCRTTSKLTNETGVSENNKDVYILSVLIRDHLRNTNELDLNLNELIQNDSLRRISNNFKDIEIEYRGGYIAVYYKFSDSRDNREVELNEKEKREIKYPKWIIKDLKEKYDGEIHFEYGERFYRIRKIIAR